MVVCDMQVMTSMPFSSKLRLWQIVNIQTLLDMYLLASGKSQLEGVLSDYLIWDGCTCMLSV